MKDTERPIANICLPVTDPIDLELVRKLKDNSIVYLCYSCTEKETKRSISAEQQYTPLHAQGV